jgi:hypothetical protein
MGMRVREDYFSPNANPRKTLPIVDLPSNWTLPDKKDLLDYKPKVNQKKRKAKKKKILMASTGSRKEKANKLATLLEFAFQLFVP